jgi:hypothetical protein
MSVSIQVTGTKDFVQGTSTANYQNPLKATSTVEFVSLEEQTRAQVLELLKTNNGCTLPCFWGITPGKAKWSEVKESLRVLSSQYSDDSEVTATNFFYSGLYFPAKDIHGPWDLYLNLGINNDVIRTISVSDFDVPNYHLGEFLLENGRPDEIWVFTNSSGSVNSPDQVGFLVSLFYREEQMMAAYGRGKATIDDAWINGCIQYSPALKIWSLDQPLSFPEAASFFYNTNGIEEGWKEISNATQGEFDVDKFYQTFMDPGVEPCFKTPKDLWFPL